MSESEVKNESSQDAERWHQELKLAKHTDREWLDRGKRIVERYRDERKGTADKGVKKYNILWANIQTLFPSMYGRTPQAQVERRHKDSDPVGRTASQILERSIQYELDNYQDYDQALRAAVLDRLLVGRGTAWVRFENYETSTVDGESIPNAYACVDAVFWEDFRQSPARLWEEVTWVARRVYMTRDDGIERFGENFKKVPLSHEPIGLQEMKDSGDDCEHLKKAKVWEIWDKSTKSVIWVVEGYPKILDKKDDPYGLDSFWPCPKPLYATQTTDTLVPVPDYSLYQDQASEIDALTQRIGLLTQALKVVGVYDATATGVQRMLSEGYDNTMIPVDNWAVFSEKGAVKGAMDFLPLGDVINAMDKCYQAREHAKQVIYEITGISDIIRGASMASETATAQQIKSQFASLRLRDNQRAVAMFASEILRIKGQMMADLYPPMQLVEMSGIAQTKDAQFAEQALQLLKTEPARNFRIEIAADSLVEIEEQSEKQSRLEFLQSAGGFLQQVLPVAQQVPELAPLMGQMLLFGIRSFRASRPLESAFDAAMATLAQPKPPQQQQPDPAQMQAQAQMQLEQAKLQIAQAKLQGEQQLAQAKLQAEMQIEQYKAQQQRETDLMRVQAETERARLVAEIEADAKFRVAQMDGFSKNGVQL